MASTTESLPQRLCYKSSGDRHAWAWASTEVRASAAEVLAYFWDVEKRCTQREDELDKAVDEQISDHSRLVFTEKGAPHPLFNREFLTRWLWMEIEGGYAIVSEPELSERRPLPNHLLRRFSRQLSRRSFSTVPVISQETPQKQAQHQVGSGIRRLSNTRAASDGTRSVVRGKFPSAMRIIALSETESSIEYVASARFALFLWHQPRSRTYPGSHTGCPRYVIHPDFGGMLPTWASHLSISKDLMILTEVQQYFQELRPLDEYDAIDGRALGMRLVYPGGPSNSRPWEAVQAVVDRHRGLKSLAASYHWLVPLLEAAVKVKKLSVNQVGETERPAGTRRAHTNKSTLTNSATLCSHRHPLLSHMCMLPLLPRSHVCVAAGPDQVGQAECEGGADDRQKSQLRASAEDGRCGAAPVDDAEQEHGGAVREAPMD